MRVDEARELVLDLLINGTPTLGINIDLQSPDHRDNSKFAIGGRVARPIHHYDGWYVPIDRGWFNGGFDMPTIHGSPFYWYVFAIPGRAPRRRPHYLLCDYLQVRDWVLDFDAPLGRDHRDHRNWRADIRVFMDDPTESTAYFRWGDEPIDAIPRPSRVVQLDNLAAVDVIDIAAQRVGLFGPGGESAAHRRLKLFVAAHPVDFGLAPTAAPFVEYRFATGDRVDVMFENHRPNRTVVEIEVAGEDNICIGIQQAVKYRSLAEMDGGYDLLSPRVQSLVVAYDTHYPRAESLADRYGVTLHTVDRQRVLSLAS